MVAIASSPVQDIAVADIHESPLNPRKHFDPKKIEELATNLREIGQLEALTVRPSAKEPGKFELVNGARRWRAAQIAGLTVLAAKVKVMTDAEALAVMLCTGSEGNVEQLTPLEEAEGYKTAMELMGLKQEGLASRFGRSVQYVRERLLLLNLPTVARTALEAGTLAPKTAIEIARIPSDAKRAEAAEGILHSEVHGGVMPSRAAKVFIEVNICRSLQGAPFNVEDAELRPEAGACVKMSGKNVVGGCPFRAGNNPEAYGDVKNPHTCMNPACFEAKVAAARARLLAKVATEGKEALPTEINAQVFPKEEAVMSWKSEYAYYTQPITRDLLKAEVSRVPTWETLLAAKGVKVWIGIDQSGHAVDLVKLTEAMVAVPAEESAIFSEESVRKYGVARPAKAAGSVVGASFVEQEKVEQGLREKADRAKKKRMKKARAWLDELATGLEGMAAAGKPAWTTYAFWSLMFERMLCALGDEDVVFVCEIFGVDGEIDAERDARAVLTSYVGKISKDRCGALVTAMTLAPWLRAEGPDAAFVTQWHDAFVAEGASPEKVEGLEEERSSSYSHTLASGAVVFFERVPHEHANVWDVRREDTRIATISGPQQHIDEMVQAWSKQGWPLLDQAIGQKFMVEVTLPEIAPGAQQGAKTPREIMADTRKLFAEVQPIIAKAAVPTVSAEESAKLAQLVKAYDSGAGMSVQRIAAEFGMSLEDVCGALEVDVQVARNLASQLRQDVEEALKAAKFTEPVTRDRIVSTATARRVKQFADVTCPSDFRRILAFVASYTKPKSPAKTGEEDES